MLMERLPINIFQIIFNDQQINRISIYDIISLNAISTTLVAPLLNKLQAHAFTKAVETFWLLIIAMLGFLKNFPLKFTNIYSRTEGIHVCSIFCK